MFDLKEFIVKNIILGIKNGSFAKEYGSLMAVNYLTKGLLVEEDVQKVDKEITAWEEQKLAEEEALKNTPVTIPEVEDAFVEEEITETEPVEEPVVE